MVVIFTGKELDNSRFQNKSIEELFIDDVSGELMTYPYPDLTKLLQIQSNASQYQSIVAKYATSLGNLRAFNIGQDYWSILPTYLRTICPFCMHSSYGKLDTYSLLGKIGPHQFLFSAHDENPDFVNICPHFLAFRQFLNFHSILPTERSYFENITGEAPYIAEWCLPEDIESYVVLHALPICRIINGNFVPSYTYFNLSYFSIEREHILRQRFESEWARGHGDPEFYPAIFYSPSPDAEADIYYNLQHWANEGKLGYLDFTQSDLFLNIGQGTQLPEIYQHIQGKRQRFIWRNGQIEYLAV